VANAADGDQNPSKGNLSGFLLFKKISRKFPSSFRLTVAHSTNATLFFVAGRPPGFQISFAHLMVAQGLVTV
jgi:hypothetical protein